MKHPEDVRKSESPTFYMGKCVVAVWDSVAARKKSETRLGSGLQDAII